MSEEIYVIPHYEPSTFHAVLTPNFPVLSTDKNSANVPRYIGMMKGPLHVTAGTPVTPDANVASAGSQNTRGIYACIDTDNWAKGQFSIRRGNYPDPNVTSLVIVNTSSQVFYYADNQPMPWDATWKVGSFGVAPAPTVSKVVSRKQESKKK